MTKHLVRSFLNLLGYEIRKREDVAVFGYDLEEEADKAILKVRPYTMLSRARLITLYQQAFFCEQQEIRGSYVECGVWKGGSVALMALANLKHGKKRRHIHLFDAFQEICEPDASVDGEKAINEVKAWSGGGTSGKLTPLVGFYDSFGGPGTLEGNRELLESVVGYDPLFLHYHQGWFQDTLPQNTREIDEIAILRLDGDWYASTKICLEYLYDKVVTGGFVIIDDYGAYEGCKKAVDEFIHERKIAAYLNHIDKVGRYWIKP